MKAKIRFVVQPGGGCRSLEAVSASACRDWDLTRLSTGLPTGLYDDFGGSVSPQEPMGGSGTGAQRERRQEQKGHGQGKKLRKSFAYVNRRAGELRGSSQGKVIQKLLKVIKKGFGS